MNAHFPCDPKQYDILSIIGRGTCSRVYKARCKTNNVIIAIKIINLDEYPLSIETIQKQTKFWSKCDHPNVVKYYGSFTNGPDLWILTELMAAGSMYDILKFGYGNGFKDETIIASIATDLVNAIVYLHSNHEIHRDIRSGNILFNAHGQAKLSDFGLATSLIQNGQKRSAALSMYGDACYMAPEMLTSNCGYTEKTDIWGLGLVIIELATGKMPYAGMKLMESMANIITKAPPALSKDRHSALICDFVSQCLNVNPKKRASAEELLEHKFLKTSRGSAAIATTILSQLAPLEQRYKILYENKADQKMQKEKSVEKMSFDFFEGDNNNKDDEKPSPRQEKEGGDLQKVETHGRFTIRRSQSASESKELLGDVSPVEKKKNPTFEALSSQLRLLKFEVSSLESENEYISDRIHQIAIALQQIKANREEEE